VDISKIMVRGPLMKVGTDIPSGRETQDARGRGYSGVSPRVLIVEGAS
jgi:hypothetical protein